LLLLWKRELMTGAAAGHSPSFHSIERLWEAYLAGCTLWTPFMDVWLTLAILKVSGIVAAVRNGTIISFEELLRAVHSLSLNIGDCDRVIASCHRLMVRFDSISRELGVKKLTAAPSLATDADRDGPTGYWALNQPFTAAAVQQQAPPESPNIRFRFREALAILQMESN
jgi:hypothetical protein